MQPQGMMDWVQSDKPGGQSTHAPFDYGFSIRLSVASGPRRLALTSSYLNLLQMAFGSPPSCRYRLCELLLVLLGEPKGRSHCYLGAIYLTLYRQPFGLLNWNIPRNSLVHSVVDVTEFETYSATFKEEKRMLSIPVQQSRGGPKIDKD